jgi:hypothetical protein
MRKEFIDAHAPTALASSGTKIMLRARPQVQEKVSRSKVGKALVLNKKKTTWRLVCGEKTGRLIV